MKLSDAEETVRKKELDVIVTGYKQRIMALKPEHEVLCTNMNDAYKRFERLKVLILGKPIKLNVTFRDIGCGYKWFKQVLDELDPTFIYKSVDIIPDFKPDICADFLDPAFEIPFAEWMVCMGTMNHSYAPGLDNYKLAHVAMEKLYKAAIQGVVIDFMSTGHPARHNTTLFYYDPAEIINIIRELGCEQWAILHDYSISEFMVVLIK